MEPQEEKRDYTEEDAKIIQNLSKKKDYYDILGIEKDANSAQIKKAYRKLAVKVHPDKNPHPKATEVFKKVSTAFSTLNDDEKRRIYD